MIVKIKEMTDKELLEEYDRARGSYSYYQAADGPMWMREETQRRKAGIRLDKVRAEVEKRGLTPNEGDYLC